MAILHRLGKGWWSRVLELYAQLTLDVSTLVLEAFDHGVSEIHRFQLEELIELAPNTGPGIGPLLQLEDDVRAAGVPLMSADDSPRDYVTGERDELLRIARAAARAVPKD